MLPKAHSIRIPNYEVRCPKCMQKTWELNLMRENPSRGHFPTLQFYPMLSHEFVLMMSPLPSYVVNPPFKTTFDACAQMFPLRSFITPILHITFVFLASHGEIQCVMGSFWYKCPFKIALHGAFVSWLDLTKGKRKCEKC